MENKNINISEEISESNDRDIFGKRISVALTPDNAVFCESEGGLISMTLTKADLYELGLSGGADSALRREKLSKALDLPQNLSANALLEAICMLVSEEEFKIAYQSISEE